ncbi:acyltransferase family protein [Hafnia alvei]|uniref:Peptidoglycan/LPS O-acetylase OafA/YrhL, contains acyltransferase and SGNH-hydrolase domains n=1 Tax=Hafnia alvei TaxID=569 RepID=A0A1C6YW31_HAFAL|nr:acyltransferase [Hafnia alvei]NLS56207.1 acyltransferase family protein [Hafnia alvei]SCM51009.1 Peptidoglycan/LPS O-acetylase OafA/YrhL, contains acyltransferase and SGNH-hydrolase domains [Hafnia alvei]
MKRIESLDIFRGICAILVMFFHIRVSGTITELSISRNAFIFVDFFFILSGFVIAMKYTNSSNTFKEYITSRFFRIYPLFFILMTISILTEILKYIAHKKLGIEFGATPFTGGSSPEFIPYYYTLTQAWFSWVKSDGFLYPSWSISIEFYMYIILWILISGKFYKSSSFAFLLFSISISLYQHGASYPNDIIRGMTGIPLGALAFYFRDKIKALPYMELPMIIICYFAVSQDYSYKYFCVAASFLITIVVFSHDAGVISKIIINRLLKYIGKLSYSIYLTHALVLYAFVLLSILIGKALGVNFSHYEGSSRVIDFGNIFINNTFIISAIIVTIITSHITNKYIEVPFMKIAKRNSLNILTK